MSAEMRKETETERTPKQCRERYKQYVRNDLSKGHEPCDPALCGCARSQASRRLRRAACTGVELDRSIL